MPIRQRRVLALPLVTVVLCLWSPAILAMPGDQLRSSEPLVGESGDLQLSVPIDAPVGTGSFQPSLGLMYSSRGGDGPFGVGWQLGQSEIRRTTRFGAPAYNALDKFELDGQLLVKQWPFGPYRTLVESLTTAQQIGAYWEVSFPNGSKARFGQTANSRVELSAGLTFRWLMSELEDVNGNVIKFAYDERDLGNRYPASISYTYRGTSTTPVGGKERRIEFHLEARPDPTIRFEAGIRRLGNL